MSESSELKTNNSVSAKERISQALVELVRDNELSDITVSMLTESALVSKSTFYRYYHDIYDIYDELMKSIFKHSIKTFKEIYIDKNISLDELFSCTGSGGFLPEIIAFTDDEIMLALNSMRIGGRRLKHIFYKGLYETLCETFSADKCNEESFSFFYEFFVLATIKCGLDDFHSGKSFDVELIEITLDALNSFLKSEGLYNG